LVEINSKFIKKQELTKSMAEKSFVLVSLKEDKTKKLTQTLSNETCRKILEYLSGVKEATETKISKELNLPMSTVHYNLKQLADNKLVSIDEFHYSEKGKEVIHYKIANKYIVIAPEDADEGFLDKLKSIMPAFIVVGATSLAIYLTPKILSMSKGLSYASSFSAGANSDMASRAAPLAAEATQDVAIKSAKIASDGAVQGTANTAMHVATTSTSTEIAIWFFIGGIVALIIFLLWEFVKDKKKKAKMNAR